MTETIKPGIKEFISNGDYCLASGVLFVAGALRGAIYDLNTGRVFSVDKKACNVLNGEIDPGGKFWNRLAELNLATRGNFEQESILPELLQRPELQFVWFEIISDDCNESCAHCYADSMPPSHRKALGLPTGGYIPLEGVKENKSVKPKLTANRWKKLIADVYSLGCKHCQFIGGEPFVYKGEGSESVLDLAAQAKSIGFEFIEIFTNGTLLTEEKVKRIKELGVNIAVSLYSKDPETHDHITNTPGSHKKTVTALQMLKRAGIPTRVETVLMRPNEHSIKETQELVEGMGFSHKHPDVLRPKGRGDNPAISPSRESVVKYALMTSPNFSVDKETLSRYVSGHSCLLGKITITDNGDVLPCIFSRNLAVGNVQDNSLQEVVIGNKLETVWRATKDQVLVCRDCEYRYVCFDCRPLSEGVNQGRGDYLSAPYPRCTYNPYSGEWAKGVWRLDDKGSPYYDETLKPIIKQVMSTEKLASVRPSGH